MLERLKVITCIPDADCRVRLREALVSIIFKADIRIVRTLKEAVSILKTEPEIPLLFLASSLGRDAVQTFVHDLTEGGTEFSTAMLVTVDRHTAAKLPAVIQLYMQGVDGFIAEPYSSDQLKQLVESVLDPKREKVVQAAARALKAVKFLASDAVRLVDERWHAVLEGRTEGGTTIRDLKRVSGGLKELYEKHPDALGAGLVAVFEGVPTPHAISDEVKKKKTKVEVQHPGRVMEALMKERGLTRDRILAIIRIEPDQFDQLIAGKSSMDEVAAREVSRVLGKTSREWLALQRKYDVAYPAGASAESKAPNRGTGETESGG